MDKNKEAYMKYIKPEWEITFVDFEEIIVTSLNTDTGDIPSIPGDGEEPF